MKYKIKFEIDYSGLSKQEVRESKLTEVLNSDRRMMELEIDPLIKIQQPKEGDIVDLFDEDYKIISTKFKMDTDCYTIIHLVESVNVIKEREDKEHKSQMERMSKMLSSI